METTASTPIASDAKAASPTASIEEITPCPKGARGSDKVKSKVDSSVWDDAATAMGRAHNVIALEELKDGIDVPSHELVSRHIHKLIQVHS